MNNNKSIQVNCPHCDTKVLWVEESLYRPFCSERCKLIDLGEWAQENHKISSNLLENPEDFPEGLPENLTDSSH